MNKQLISLLIALLAIPSLQAQTAGKFRDVKAGLFHVLILKNDGTLWAMGMNNNG